MPSHYGLSGYGQMGSYSFSNNSFFNLNKPLSSPTGPMRPGSGLQGMRPGSGIGGRPTALDAERSKFEEAQRLQKMQDYLDSSSAAGQQRAIDRATENSQYAAQARNTAGQMPQLNNFGDFVKAALALKYGR